MHIFQQKLVAYYYNNGVRNINVPRYYMYLMKQKLIYSTIMVCVNSSSTSAKTVKTDNNHYGLLDYMRAVHVHCKLFGSMGETCQLIGRHLTTKSFL